MHSFVNAIKQQQSNTNKVIEMTIQELATKYLSLFITKTRDNGKKFLCLKDADENLSQLIYEAHNKMLPDDYKYQFIYEALESIAESDDLDCINMEADIYNNDLLNWVSSNLTRADYVDEAVANYEYKDFYTALSYGQLMEKEEVLAYALTSLENILEEILNEDN